MLTIVLLIALALIAVTALPLAPSNEWWVRVWDFPRTQIAALIVLVFFAGSFLVRRNEWWAWALALALAMCLAFHLYRIWPFTPWHPVQVKSARDCREGSEIRLLTANVLQTNRNTEILFGEISRREPDLVLLVETDGWWHEQLQRLRPSYPHWISQPMDNGYGMHLLSRFPLIEPEVRFLIEDDVPSIRTRLRLSEGTEVLLYGVHPRPPPHSDTAQRDAELLVVASEVQNKQTPAIVAGDLNDVAWSRTNDLFQKVSGLLDPRIGRGIYPTFNANWLLLRWPLDHVFFSDSFLLRALAVLPHFGSDHFPLFVSICYEPAAQSLQREPRPEPQDRERAREVIQEGRDEAKEQP